MIGVFGKLPQHGDFVRRGLPQAFVQAWDEWLQTRLGAVREALGDDFAAAWAAAPTWCFALPEGVCGPAPVAGVLIPSQDAVGRQFPLTLAAVLPADASAPDDDWYAKLADAGLTARDDGRDVDSLLAELSMPALPPGAPAAGGVPAMGWWMPGGRRWPLAVLPSPAQFRSLLSGGRLSERLLSSGATHTGTVRSRNEDAFVDRGDIGVWAVADGAGGHGAGDVASAAVAEALTALPAGLSAAEILAQVRLRLAAVHAELQRRAAAAPGGDIMATTVVVLMARGDHFACLWAGDSRAYLLRDGNLQQMTHDHSLVQELVESGLLAPESAESHPQANVITRAVGSREPLELDKVSGNLQPKDRVLLCTDGLFKALRDSEIAQAVSAGCSVQQLLDQALQAGARDNLTALLIEV
jgi:protein phosphatase/serine/threonine-protein phosphatase Stp1